jgi:NTE family protein
MAKSALVLGGGGVLGMSWETGVLAGLLEAGVDVTGADLVVGTSAGSVVGTQVACGQTMAEMLAFHFEPREGGVETTMEFDVQNVMSIFQKWAALPEVTREACAEIGRMAVASKTMGEERFVSSFEELVGVEWPERSLLLTAVDAESGDFQPWDRGSGVALLHAVASSCAVPGLFPVISIKGRRYTDGGVRSGTNADLAKGYDAVLILAPIGARSDGIDPLLARTARAEAEALRAAGSQVELAFPDEGSLEAMGINRMDTTRRPVAAEAGQRQGRALAPRLEAAWRGAGVR